jgi:4-hydroxybenzoate polyprenyltransferase
MRFQQWIKNFFIFAALIFSANLFNVQDLLLTILGFILFSIAVSGVYIFNDIIDLEKDKLHPLKTRRPLPSEKLSVKAAAIASFILVLIGLLGAFILKTEFGVVLSIYVIINVWYSYQLKSIVILDVMTIATGFVLRVIGGAVLIGVPTSEWLIICMVLLSLFLGFSKRRHEILILENLANTHRSVLQHYNPYFLDQMIGIVTATIPISCS